MRKLALIYILLICTGVVTFAEISLPAIFSDNMVLQQSANVPVWGKAKAGEQLKITPSWDKKEYKVTADPAGNWKTAIETPSAGGPYEITFTSGKKMFELKNILIGEVWFCSGQSNMEMPMGGWGKINNYEEEISLADYPEIRFVTIHKSTRFSESTDFIPEQPGWEICSPSNMEEFSATAYFFGRTLHKNLHVPIGLIHSSWGGTPAEAWTSRETIKAVPEFREIIENIESINATDSTPSGSGIPSVLFNAMVKPLIPFNIRGIIWNQGEANSNRPEQYKTLLPLLISDWRDQWDSNLPFYYTQLPNYNASSDEYWPELREAQLETLKVCNTAMAVTIDIGNPEDVHAKNKQDVGLRLALLALKNTYGQQITSSGPIYKSYDIDGKQIRLKFESVEDGLISKGGELKGFTIAGPDGKFHPATATINGNEVLVSSPAVNHPLHVRYGWENSPVCNLYNKGGLPASPFRTDRHRRTEQ